VKLKTTSEVDAVVGGFTAPRGGREHFGALLAGLYDGRGLRFIGGVGPASTRPRRRKWRASSSRS